MVYVILNEKEQLIFSAVFSDKEKQYAQHIADEYNARHRGQHEAHVRGLVLK